ncbi:LysR family transcriptional regulator [Agrobacterium sp. MOPV5]|uniref:LysR family transcriptional regulator n=1 Tax=Agrobacterium leguminum TaxID=2792015 RepID=UPI0018C2F597|nr:LysR family transcriptional regulator [Agrobacterium leguminum]MBG0512093.1 LysR family transcriptional regulator [Agrobacterium leguminum]
MEFRHYRYFLAAAEELHFTRAAQRLNVAQPALSQQIRQFEDELGSQLFHRLTRGVELTEAGEALLPFARAVLLASEQGALAAQRAAKGELGKLRIGFTSSASFNPIVTSAIGRFRQAYPELELELQEYATTILMQSLRDGRIQLAFARPADDEVEGFRHTPLPDEAMWAALPVSHRFAEADEFPLSMLSGERFIVYPRTNGRQLYDAMIAACGQAGFSPRIVQEAPQLASTINLVAAGVGVALVPASMRHVNAPGVSYRRITEPVPLASMQLVHGPDLLMTAAVRNFIRCLEDAKREALAENPQAMWVEKPR